MKKFKIVVSKDDKKYTLALTAENEFLAKERVHKEWYSILSIEEYIENENSHKFIFEAKKDWEFKKGQIVWDDILKSYYKLTKNLWYQVIYIYAQWDANLPLDKKEKIVSQLREEYNELEKWATKDIKEKLKSQIDKDKEKKQKLEWFYLKKELDEHYKLIDFILKKIESIIIENTLNINTEQKEKLKELYNAIIKLKKSTNIAKLKQVWEKALLKIGALELEKLEWEKNDYISSQLKETNKLLKNIGSKEHFLEKNKDIKYIFHQILEKIKIIKSSNKWENSDQWYFIDKKSHSFIKNKLFLKKYEQKLNDINMYMLKNFIKLLFDKNLKEEQKLKKKVIKQNIILLKAKQKWVNFSYTSIIKWYNSFFNYIFKLLNLIKNFIVFISIVFGMFFIWLFIFWKYFWEYHFSFHWVYYFIFILCLFFVLHYAKNIFFLVFNVVFFFFITIFLVVNF